MRHLLTVDDLTDDDIDRFRALPPVGAAGITRLTKAPLVGLLFAAPSLRTRVGFAAATHRVGGTVIDVGAQEIRSGTSGAESIDDIIRTVSGMVDLLVYRGDRPAMEIAASSAVPVINGGDDSEHPTQALIDLVTMERHVGRVGNLHVAICGDLSARCTTSLLALLGRVPPRRLSLVAPAGRDRLTRALPRTLVGRTERTATLDPTRVDVVYLPGLPEGTGQARLDSEGRRPYQIDTTVLAGLASHAAVLSPMPVIDEITDDARTDARVRLFDAIDASVQVRIEVLALLAG